MAYQRSMGDEPVRLAPGAAWLLRRMPQLEESVAQRESQRRSRIVTGVLVTAVLLAGAGGAGYFAYDRWKSRQE
jgi:hypothetical protein